MSTRLAIIHISAHARIASHATRARCRMLWTGEGLMTNTDVADAERLIGKWKRSAASELPTSQSCLIDLGEPRRVNARTPRRNRTACSRAR